MTPNPAVADRARTIADQAPGGSLTRRAAGCIVVAYSTTRSDEHARKVLGQLDDELRDACHALADELTSQIQEEA
ncbi:hypothetical protein SAMN05216275_14139 [Streptosporangium canum]|uniref:Uncharacterized protein n=1 Tax=Streptosporangium canum TaxID=324952 RepID=A0A1I4DJF1_9ACTN|nr:hypothetical protein [Streptosporangium canum]SFK92136.1 hypothetical protein SAMN05216275_14139 [Streptosporangium canum]